MDNIRKQGCYDFKSESNFQLKKSKIPRITGNLAWAFNKLSSTFLLDYVITKIKRNSINGILLNMYIEEEPTQYPLNRNNISNYTEPTDVTYDSLKNDIPYTGGYPSISQYHLAYREQTKTPIEIINKIIDICNSEKIKSLKAVASIDIERMIKSATESTERFKNGKEISLLDGIPFFVHEELKIKGMTSFMGTSYFEIFCDSNSLVIDSLIEKGAICCGYANMVQFGSNSIGNNPSPLRPSVRNPYDRTYYCGGSNSGAACIVSAGIAPFCIGIEGIGSVRLTAGLTGVVGFKPTFGRSRDSGSLYAEGSPFTLIGPIITCVRDSAIIYGAISGPNPDHLIKNEQPCIRFPNFSKKSLESFKFGVFTSYIKCANPKYVEKFFETVQIITSNGGTIEEISIPELKESFAASILGFTKAIGQSLIFKVGQNVSTTVEDIGTTLMIEVGKSIDEKTYDIINRQRTRATNIMEKVFEKVDIVILLTSSIPPTRIEGTDQKWGMIDEYLTNAYTFFTFLPSFCGVPAISINMGYEPNTKLPISLQLFSSWWKEDMLLEVANQIEHLLPEKILPECFKSPFID